MTPCMYMRLFWVMPHCSAIFKRALFSAISSAISIGIMATAGVLTHSHFVFPSLGPTAFLFFSTPTAPSASPRNTLIGHTIGVCMGYLCLIVTGLALTGPALATDMKWRLVIAAGLSLGLTSGLMVLMRVDHPPAAATTLLVSLNIISRPWQLVVLMVAVGLLTLQAIVINRLAGISYPLWSALPMIEQITIKEKAVRLNGSRRARKRGRHRKKVNRKR